MSFIRFDDRGTSESGKTRVWVVVSTHHKVAPVDQNVTLGKVAWYASWRRYCFFPSRDTVYEQECLRDIAKFCEDSTMAHRSKK